MQPGHSYSKFTSWADAVHAMDKHTKIVRQQIIDAFDADPAEPDKDGAKTIPFEGCSLRVKLMRFKNDKAVLSIADTSVADTQTYIYRSRRQARLAAREPSAAQVNSISSEGRISAAPTREINPPR